MDFGEKLKLLRQEHDVTQDELAKAISVRRPAISGYETKHQQPDFERLLLIADFFSVSTDFLLGRTNVRSTKPAKESISISLFSEQQQRLNDIYKSLDDINQVMVLERAETLLDKQQQKEQAETLLDKPQRKVQDKRPAPIEGAS